MVDGLLHLARNDAAGHQTKLEYVDLAALLKDVAESLRPLAEEKGLEIVDRVPDHDLYVVGDSDGLIRLFLEPAAQCRQIYRARLHHCRSQGAR